MVSNGSHKVGEIARAYQLASIGHQEAEGVTSDLGIAFPAFYIYGNLEQIPQRRKAFSLGSVVSCYQQMSLELHNPIKTT